MWNFAGPDDEETDESQPVPGVIDTIGLGYSHLLVRPYVILVPIFLDAFLWLGLKVTSGPLTLKLSGWLETQEYFGPSMARFLDRFQDFNMLELASLRLPTFRLPTFIPLMAEADERGLGSWDPTVESASWFAVLVIGVLMIALSFVIGAGYLQWLAAVSRDSAPEVSARSVALLVWRIVSWLVIVVGLFALVTLPVLVTIAVLEITGFGQIAFVSLILVIPSAWGYVFLFFSIFAIAANQLSAIESIRSSYEVVRSFFWQSLGFIIAFIVVTSGFPYVWRFLLSNPLGAIIAIIGNSFIASGMIIAALIFYRDRAAVLAQQPALSIER